MSKENEKNNVIDFERVCFRQLDWHKSKQEPCCSKGSQMWPPLNVALSSSDIYLSKGLFFVYLSFTFYWILLNDQLCLTVALHNTRCILQKMACNSTGTQLNFNNTGPADPILTASPSPFSNIASQFLNESCLAVSTKNIADKLKKKQKQLIEDKGCNNTKSRFLKLLTSRFQKPKAFTNADNRHCF